MIMKRRDFRTGTAGGGGLTPETHWRWRAGWVFFLISVPLELKLSPNEPCSGEVSTQLTFLSNSPPPSFSVLSKRSTISKDYFIQEFMNSIPFLSHPSSKKIAYVVCPYYPHTTLVN